MNLEKFFNDNPDWRPYADLVAIPPLPEELMKEFVDVSPEPLSRCMEYVSEGGGLVTRGAIYTRVRREDKRDNYAQEADKWATMLCLNAPPGLRTNDTFWGGRKHFSEVFGTEYADRVRKGLAKKGVVLGANDEYMPELARFPNDPEAVIPFGGGRSYIKRLCGRRGWACEGAVEVEHRQPDVDPHTSGVPMAEDLIVEKARLLAKADPKIKKLPRREIRERVLDKFGPSK